MLDREVLKDRRVNLVNEDLLGPWVMLDREVLKDRRVILVNEALLETLVLSALPVQPVNEDRKALLETEVTSSGIRRRRPSARRGTSPPSTRVAVSTHPRERERSFATPSLVPTVM